MSERYRFRCGRLPASRERGKWSSVRPKCLEIGRSGETIRLNTQRLSTVLGHQCSPVTWDLLDLAAYVYVADQMVGRGGRKEFEYGQKWRRHFRFEVGVREPDIWNHFEVKDALIETLTFLSDDDYEFVFVRSESPNVVEDYLFEEANDSSVHDYREVLLFSGGIDSLCGAVNEMFVSHRRPVLVSHWANPKTLSRQEELVRDFRDAVDLPRSMQPLHITLTLNKKKHLTRDFDQRCRSFVFASLGAIVATGLGLDGFRLCENGITSLNLPISPQIVGARASRTTHPRSLRLLGQLVSEIAEEPFQLENPFLWQTKCEIVDSLARHSAAHLIGLTRSCGGTLQSSNAHPHCGKCSQCIDRRLAIVAAGLESHDPETGYRLPLFVGERKEALEQMTLAAYVETCRQLHLMSPPDFFKKYGEIGRALSEMGISVDQAAEAIFQLHRRHACQVRLALERGMQLHADRFVARDLPDTCLIRLMEPAPEPLEDHSVAMPSLPENYFYRSGDYWRIRYANGPKHLLLHQVGNEYLQILLSQPGREIIATDLLQQVQPRFDPRVLGSQGETIDAKARKEYRVRQQDLEELIAMANENGDATSLEGYQNELAAIEQQLAEGEGISGKLRKKTDRERVRKSVAAALERTTTSIQRYDPALAKHLSPPTLRRGKTLCYEPRPLITWATEI